MKNLFKKIGSFSINIDWIMQPLKRVQFYLKKKRIIILVVFITLLFAGFYADNPKAFKQKFMPRQYFEDTIDSVYNHMISLEEGDSKRKSIWNNLYGISIDETKPEEIRIYIQEKLFP